MKDQNHIEDLLRKYTEGSLSPLEAKEFVEIIKSGDNNEELKQILTSFWESEDSVHVEVQSERILEQLKIKMKNEDSDIHFQRDIKARIEWSVILRYAAVVIITFGLSWFGKDYLFNNSKVIAKAEVDKQVFSEISVSYGSKSKVILPDGTVVNLNSGTTLRYPSRFDSDTRDVYIEGEAFFDVKKDPNHPFCVKTKGITVRVLGTKFNVKAYPDEKRVEATLVSGSVELYSNRREIKEKNRLLVLKPSQQASFEMNSNTGDSIVFMALDNVDVTPIVSWKNNELIFRDEKFADLAQRLERWYDVDIEITDQKLKTTTLSGVFEKETIEQSLAALRLATPFEYKMEMNKIVISRR